MNFLDFPNASQMMWDIVMIFPGKGGFSVLAQWQCVLHASPDRDVTTTNPSLIGLSLTIANRSKKHIYESRLDLPDS